LVLFVPRLGKQKLETVTQPRPHKNEKFHELPEPTRNSPYHLPLNNVIPKEQVKRLDKSGSISFHIVGDTGGTKTPAAQHVVEIAMESDFDHNNPSKNLSFLYHLGDVIYKFGEASEYYSQFYEPYAHYPAPIFAIPGNNYNHSEFKLKENYYRFSSYVMFNSELYTEAGCLIIVNYDITIQ